MGNDFVDQGRNLARMKFAAEIFPEKPGKIIDLGCSYGLLGDFMEPKGFGYVGVDIAERIKEARKRGRNIVKANIEERLPFKDKTFDYVFCGDTLEHLYRPWKVLGEAKRLLKKDGILIVAVPNEFNFLKRGKFIFNKPISNTALKEGTHIWLATLQQWEKFFGREGFKIEKRIPTIVKLGIIGRLSAIWPSLLATSCYYFLGKKSRWD